MKTISSKIIILFILILASSLIVGIKACNANYNPDPPDLIINKAVDKSQASPGEEIVYTLNYENIGDTQATGVVIKDVFNYTNQQYLTFISATPSPTSGTDTWNIGTLNPGQSGQVSIRARISNSIPSGTIEIKNRGSIDSNETPFMYSNCVATIVTGSANIELTIEKLVRNISDGTSWYSSVYANPGDELEFKLKINSVGNEIVRNLRARDSLPSKLTYISGSTKVDGSYRSDGIISSTGIYLDDLGVYNDREVTFRARAQSTDNFNSGTTTLTNYGYAWASDVNRIYDTVQVRVQKNQEPETRAIAISKLVRNLSRGQTAWYDSVIASPSQEIEFSIQVTNIGDTTLSNVRVSDVLPAKMTLIGGGSTYGSGVIGAGMNIGSLIAGETKTITFRAQVANEDNFGAGSTTLINTAFTSADNVSQVSDQASVVITKPGEVKGEEFPPTGINTIGLMFLGLISAVIAFALYCRTREEKLLEVLNSSSNRLVKAFIKLYFQIKFFIIATKIRFKQIYW